MQKQCHIILYIPDYHVNIHRVCSTVKHWRRADLRRHVRQCYVVIWLNIPYSALTIC